MVLYAAGEGAAPIAAGFTRATGVPVTVVRLSTGPMLARIAAEGRRPEWTLAWFDGDTAAANLDRSGLLARDTVPPAAWTAIGASLVPKNGSWTPVAFTLAGVDVSLNHPLNRRVDDDDPIPKLGMADPALSGPAYTQLAGLVAQNGGWPQGRAAIHRIPAGGLNVAATSPNVVTQLLDGRIQRGLLQSNTAYLLASRDPRVKVTPPDHPTILANVIVEAAGLSVQRRADADRFLRYVTSQSTQDARLRDGRVDALEWATVETTAALPAALPSLAPLRLNHLDPYRWGSVQADVIDDFETTVARR